MLHRLLLKLRALLFLSLLLGVFLLGVEVYFVVTNSNRPDFFPEGEPQEMTSGLFSAYVHEENPDHIKMKAKASILCDFDLDGDLDLYFGYEDSYYFENDGEVFKDKTEAYDIEDSGCRGVIAGDVDNNGYPDMLKWRFLSETTPENDCGQIDSEEECDAEPDCNWGFNHCNFNGDMVPAPHVILMNDGNNYFEDGEFLPAVELPFLHSLGLIDADLDGDLDLLAIQEENDDQFMLYLNEGLNGDGFPRFELAFTFYRDYGAYSASRILAIADYDGDGDQDVYVGRKYGINWLFENQTLTGSPGEVSYNSNPEPFFIESAYELGVDDPEVDPIGSMGYGAAWGDYDNDQDFDLYVANWGVNRLYDNDENQFTNVAKAHLIESDTLSNGLSWGDYNNDGLLDIWTSNIRNPDDVFINLGDAQWDATSSPQFLSASQDVVSGDVDGDGYLDVFAPGLKMVNGPPGAKFTSLLYKNVSVDSSALTNNWLKIRLEGSKSSITNGGWSTQSNKSAIGARVVLHLSDQDIMREVIAGKGHGNMEPLLLHFGMNTHLSAQGMTIYWPSRNPQTNQRKVTYVDGPIDANLAYTFVEDIGFVGMKGDANADEVVNVQDVVITVNLLLSDETPQPEIFWAVDLNYDNILNVLDVVRILNLILS